MIGVELTGNDGKPDGKFRDQVISQCFARGLLLLSCGDGTIRFCPPLIVRGAEVETAAAIFDGVLRELDG